MQEPVTPERSNAAQTDGKAADNASPQAHTRRRTEVLQQKIAEEFKVKNQQVHEDISQIREQTFKQIASTRELPASAAYEKIQDRFKGAAIEFEESQKLKRQQQFEEVAGIRRQRASSLPFAPQQNVDSQPKQDTEAARKEIKSSGRKSVREIASAFQGSSLPQTMESFLQAYVQQQSAHRRAGSNSWQTTTGTPKKKKQGQTADSTVDVKSAVAELESMTEEQKEDMMNRFVDIRRTHGLETSTAELDNLRKALMMDSASVSEATEPRIRESQHEEYPALPKTPPSSPILPSPNAGANAERGYTTPVRKHVTSSMSPSTPAQHFTPVLNLPTGPSPTITSEHTNMLPRVPSIPPEVYQQQQQSPSQNTAESSGGDYIGNSTSRQQSSRALSFHSAGTSQAVVGDDSEHNDHESQISASIDTTSAAHHTDIGTMSRSASVDERTSVTTTTVGAVFGESVHNEGSESYDIESADANAVLVPEVAIRSSPARAHPQQQHLQDDELQDEHIPNRKKFWCC